jgi:hypothetical protein
MKLKFRAGYMRGHNLSPDDRQHVISAYVHRSTGDMNGCLSGYLQFYDDLDWLRNTYFKVTKKFRLDRRTRSCESYPTWPNNPELQR